MILDLSGGLGLAGGIDEKGGQFGKEPRGISGENAAMVGTIDRPQQFAGA